MKNCLIRIIFALIVSVIAVTSALADIKVKTKTTSAGQTVEGTTQIKGARQRVTQSFAGATSFDTLYQCDLKKMIQINDRAKKYMVTDIAAGAATTAVASPQPGRTGPSATRRGGVVTYTTTITDTGERKDFFGFTARHLKSVMTADSTPDACNPFRMRMETDGWYIDLEYDLFCSAGAQYVPQMAASNVECKDEIRFKRVGSAKLGYPVLVTTTFYDENGSQTSTTTTEVVDLSKTTLDASLFDVPAGYTEAKDFNELMGIPSVGSMMDRGQIPADRGTDSAASAVEAKRPGLIRVGVVAISNKTNSNASTDSMRSALIGSISGSNIDAVQIDSNSSSAIEAEAKQKGCDYILYTDIAQLKKSGSKVGGLLGRATGVGVANEKYEVRLDFKLFPVGSTSPQLVLSSTSKEEGAEEVILRAAAEREGKAVVAELQKRR